MIEMTGAAIARLQADRSVLIEQMNWQVRNGDFWVVGGLHRAGKSALLATAAGLQPPRAGTHYLFGANIAGLDPDSLLEQRLRVGLVFERGGCLFSHLSVAENVALPLCYHRNLTVLQAEERVREVLMAVDLVPLAQRKVVSISRDQSQRAALARALVLQPEVLFVDNPCSGLDPRERYWWQAFLSELSRGHKLMDDKPLTLVLTTDDFRPWAARAKQFACINQQRFFCLGGQKELHQNEDPLIRELLATGLSAG